MSLLYTLGILFFYIAYLPKMVWRSIFNKDIRKNLWQRLGKNLPSCDIPKEAFVIWVHAVSVGETKAAAILGKKLKEIYPQSFLIISSITATGHEEAKRSFPYADAFFFLPLDFPWIVKRVVKKFRPNLMIFVETDLWYNFIRACKAEGAKICLVSGKLSPRSAKRFHQALFFSKRLFSLLDHIACQDEMQKERFLYAGADPNKLSITGNLKWDFSPEFLSLEELSRWKELLSIGNDERVITLASTHVEEEPHLLKIMQEMLQGKEKYTLFLAPRHVERVISIERLLRGHKLEYSLLSQANASKKSSLILVDTMGNLPILYQLSQLTLIGGSFEKRVGGHNILEPIFYGCPVIFGPHMWQQESLKDLVLRKGGGWQLTLHEVLPKVEEYFSAPSLQMEVKNQGKELLKKIKGSSAQTMAPIEEMLSTCQK